MDNFIVFVLPIFVILALFAICIAGAAQVGDAAMRKNPEDYK